MRMPKRPRITKAMVARMFADAVMVNAALVAALLLRFLLHFAIHGQDPSVDYHKEYWEYVWAYCQSGWALTGICLVVFYLCGFYTYGRGYQGRYKALVIFQAVGLGYLVFAVVTYLFWERLGFIEIPRGALIFSWAVNLALTLTSRTWTSLWERVVRPEREAMLRANSDRVRRVLVIGGAGYIGSALLPKLLSKGYHVRVLDRFLYGKDPIRHLVGSSNLELVEGDLRNVEQVVQAMDDVDAVVHLGAIVGDPACEVDEDVTVKVNLSATQMIAQVAKACGVHRFVFASTCSVYGADDHVLDERSEVKPISLYGKTKLAAERGLRAMADRQFTPTILRFATIYGLSGRTRFDLVVNLLAAKAKFDGLITVYGGDQWRPFIHVDDAALAVFEMLKAPLPLVGNETFNVGSDEQNYTIEEIGKLVYQQAVGAELILNESVTDRRNYRVSFRKIRNRLNFQPQWTVDGGIRQVLEAIASGEVRDYRASRYHNVKLLSEAGMIESIRTEDSWIPELLRLYESSGATDEGRPVLSMPQTAVPNQQTSQVSPTRLSR